MTLKQIKDNIEKGNKVYCSNTNYEVIKDNVGQYLIVCKSNGYTIGLTWRDGKTLNGDKKEFFIN